MDGYVSNVVKFLNIDYFLDSMNFGNFVGIQGIVCHALVSLFFLLLLMVLTRQLGTINLSSQRKFVTKIFSFAIVTMAKTLQFLLLTFLLKIFSCDNDQASLAD